MTDDEARKLIIYWAKMGIHLSTMNDDTYREAMEAVRIMEDITLNG